MPKGPESEILAKSFADMGEKCGENLAKNFADFRPSISRRSGHKKLHEKLAANSAGRETKSSFTARLWELGGATSLLHCGSSPDAFVKQQSEPFLP